MHRVPKAFWHVFAGEFGVVEAAYALEIFLEREAVEVSRAKMEECVSFISRRGCK
jgi:hypothetical protein